MVVCSLVDENQDFRGAFFLPPTSQVILRPFPNILRISNLEYFSLHLFYYLFTMAVLRSPKCFFFLSFFSPFLPACPLSRALFSMLRGRSCLNLGQAGEFSSHLCLPLSSFLSFHSSPSSATFPVSSSLTSEMYSSTPCFM